MKTSMRTSWATSCGREKETTVAAAWDARLVTGTSPGAEFVHGDIGRRSGVRGQALLPAVAQKTFVL